MSAVHFSNLNFRYTSRAANASIFLLSRQLARPMVKQLGKFIK
jgi:hypothetical protein